AAGRVGAILGVSGGGVAVRAAFGCCAGNGWPSPGRHPKMGRLGASPLCTDSLRCDRDDRWVFPATLHHEADGEGSHVGVNLYSDCAGDLDSVLGCTAFAAIACNPVCI